MLPPGWAMPPMLPPCMAMPPVTRMAIFLLWNLSELTRSLPSGNACTSKVTSSSLRCGAG
eukprot:CAMPEP_0115088058 /NCGR_PEP_ID=MMETSP0227-20121206/23742_1 /TAXON_ID=89957 /ORGANISM="Polarella glacialis, Strain CCMP 1383" /LENGTH=59 /DNA_ID=CAMNT_0002478209 /DNA_START=56 /DNA_END=232 /DNA_ORIENTATION=-